MSTFQLTATLKAVGAVTAMLVLAGCGPSASTASAPGVAASGTTAPVSTASSAAQPSATVTTSPATAPSTSASPVATSSSPATATSGCATKAGFLPHSSITVCPDAAPVGGTVHVIIKGCAQAVAGVPAMPAAGMFFLGPNSWLGTNGGGGANVRYSPLTSSSEATGTFTIPATYNGGNEKGGPYPTLRTAPGAGYVFTTDPAGACRIPFTVTAG